MRKALNVILKVIIILMPALLLFAGCDSDNVPSGTVPSTTALSTTVSTASTTAAAPSGTVSSVPVAATSVSTAPTVSVPAATTATGTVPDGGDPDVKRVIDQAGREVLVPRDIKTVAVIWGPATNVIVSLGKGSTIISTSKMAEFFIMVEPEMSKVVPGKVGIGQVDMEAMAAAKPDLFVHRATDLRTLDAVQGLGIASVGIMVESEEDIKAVLALLGEVLGAEDKAAELLSYYDDLMAQAKELTKDVLPEEKKTAVVMGSDVGSVAHGAMLQSVLIEAAGGVNPAKEVEFAGTWPVVGTERIFDWNPEFIFFTSSNARRAESMLNDPAWSGVEAVKNKNVFVFPSQKDPWDFPGVASTLGSLFMLSKMYPEKLSEEDFHTIIKDFYKYVYDLEVTPESLGY